MVGGAGFGCGGGFGVVGVVVVPLEEGLVRDVVVLAGVEWFRVEVGGLR